MDVLAPTSIFITTGVTKYYEVTSQTTKVVTHDYAIEPQVHVQMPYMGARPFLYMRVI